jgi:hypothetical protein
MKLILLVIAVLAMASVVKAVPAASQDLEQADFDKLSDFTEDDVDATPIELTKDNADATLDELTEDDLDDALDETKKKKKKKVTCSQLTCPPSFYKFEDTKAKICDCVHCRMGPYGSIAPVPECKGM